ncbi:MAG: hypothetical protein FWF79_02030 [Defluviitaleaceae bacterium]|nr:hypothetical protein [Defluviitaleaceae bacterium]
MAAFELQDTSGENDALAPVCASAGGPSLDDRRKVKDECIVAYKVYDSCRRQNCLTVNELGAAVHARKTEEPELLSASEGHPIVPPEDATSVTMGKVRVASIKVLDKQTNPFKPGFWDVDIEFKLEYTLTFRIPGEEDKEVEARSVFTMKSTLFGSMGSDLAIGTDLYGDGKDKSLFSASPFVWVEAKAIGLAAKIHRSHGRPDSHGEVHVTIGLFCILKLFRLVHLNVQSRGFCIPDECRERNIDPCEYFQDMDFPMDIFAPPQRTEFNAGISENISKIKL